MFAKLERFVSHDMSRKYSALKLAFFWILGLILGFDLFVVSGVRYASLVRGSIAGAVSAGGLVIRVITPFLICLIGIFLDQRWLVYCCAFVKSALLVFTTLCTMVSFGSGGWLMRFFVLFTDTWMCALWYGFFLYCLSGSMDPPEKPLLFCAIGLLIAAIDFRVIMPLLGRINIC